MTESTTPVPANPSSNIILPTAPEKTNPVGLPAAESIILVPFAPNARFLLKTVLTDVPDTTPATVVPPASPTPTVTFPPNPAATDALLTTPALNARLVKPTRTAARPRFLVLTVVQAATPAASAPLVRATRIVTCPVNLVTADALPQTPAANALPASPVRLRTLVPAFPAGLTLTAPVALVTATPDIRAMQIPDVLKWIPVLTQRRHPAVQASVKTLGRHLVPKTEQPITTGAVRPNVLPDRPAPTELV
mgnify:CR=1 FL=1